MAQKRYSARVSVKYLGLANYGKCNLLAMGGITFDLYSESSLYLAQGKNNCFTGACSPARLTLIGEAKPIRIDPQSTNHSWLDLSN